LANFHFFMAFCGCNHVHDHEPEQNAAGCRPPMRQRATKGSSWAAAKKTDISHSNSSGVQGRASSKAKERIRSLLVASRAAT
jgi:hypothetical protein